MKIPIKLVMNLLQFIISRHLTNLLVSCSRKRTSKIWRSPLLWFLSQRTIRLQPMSHPNSFRLFGPQGRASQESKKEGCSEINEIHARFVSNKVIRLEKNLQKQQVVQTNQRTFQPKKPPPRRPLQQEKKTGRDI